MRQALINAITTFYTKVLRSIYTFLYYVAFPGILLRLLWRSRHSVGYRQRWNERFGYIKRLAPEKHSIWVHAVSVGETLAAIPLIKALKQHYPDYNIVVTTTTPTGSAQVIKHLNHDVMHVYSPYDVPSCVNRFLRRTNTRLCIIMETELWPNMLRCCKNRSIPVVLANGRLSERAKRRYLLIGSLTKLMLQTYTLVAAQGVLDGERLIDLGLDPKRLMVSGNIKFDIKLSDTLINDGLQLRQEWGTTHRPTLVAASTHEGEEAILLNAFKRIREKIPDTLLIIVPRHPERFTKVGKLCEGEGFSIVQRSLKQKPSTRTDVILGDTMGELCLIYAAADIAFVGGSLVPIGGHNLIEPAAIGMPILTGPNLQNFTEISRLLKKAGAAQIVSDERSIAKTVIALFSAKELGKRMGLRAREVVTANSGALAKHIEWIERIFPTQHS